ncbi:MAG: DMT family transporter [Treponema sp.]|jgi:drug/metabolite transporter (DMT)-like permease|nr:DMT family transporter [Treponema sp.]
MNRRTFRADALLFLTAGLWGFGFVAQSSGMDYVGPFTYNALRFPLGSLSLLPLIAIMKSRGTINAPRKTAAVYFRMTAAAGAVLFIAVGLQQTGIMFTTVGNAGFITGFYVVLTPVFGIFLGKKTGIPTWIGMICAITGLYFIFAAGNFSSLNPGDLIILISAVFWAFHILLIDHLVQRTDPLILSAGQFAWCGLFCLVSALVLEPFIAPWTAVPESGSPPWTTLAELSPRILAGAAVPVLYGGIVSVGAAYTFQVVAQKDAPPAHATIILCLEGVFAAAGGILLRGEKPGPFTLLGFVCMLCAMVITQWDVTRPARRTT